MWSTIAAVILAIERLTPLLSKAVDLAIKLREDAQEHAAVRRKADADAKLTSDRAAIDKARTDAITPK